jgi:hypothetical protein
MRLLFEQGRRVMPEYDGKGNKKSFRKGSWRPSRIVKRLILLDLRC